MKKMMLVNRMVEENSIAIGVSVLFTKRDREKKAMMFEISTIGEGFGSSNLNFTSDTGVFFKFDKEKLSDKYYRGERIKYNALLCALQRYGEARDCEVTFKTLR